MANESSREKYYGLVPKSSRNTLDLVSMRSSKGQGREINSAAGKSKDLNIDLVSMQTSSNGGRKIGTAGIKCSLPAQLNSTGGITM